ncbi:MAG: hypothetical protein LC104_04230 [Bacteroidales bacterium]|nr:hypothetical protein [Bacteroidales bacterium]
MTPLPAEKVLEAYYLEARCRLLDLAAILDRFDRGAGAPAMTEDPRVTRIRQGIAALLATPTREDRAETVQQIFSLEYDPSWKRPDPR